MAKSISDKEKRGRARISAVPLELTTLEFTVARSDVSSVLVFEVGGAQYGIGAENTEGVVDCPRVTPLPSPPEGIVGLTSVRGRMTVVMDLGAGGQELTRKRLILVKGDAQLGLLADRVEGIVALEARKIRPVAHGKDKLTSEQVKFAWLAKNYFKSGKLRVPIIDVERLCEA